MTVPVGQVVDEVSDIEIQTVAGRPSTGLTHICRTDYRRCRALSERDMVWHPRTGNTSLFRIFLGWMISFGTRAQMLGPYDDQERKGEDRHNCTVL